MKVLGLIVEYNPFHNGHIYHIQKAKELLQPDVTIAIMSGNFVQRGEPAIVNKWKRANIASQYGIDLVVELPFVYASQSADYFAAGAINILHACQVTDLVFGSECGDINVFKNIAQATIEHQEEYDSLVKESMHQGKRYADACNQALSLLLGQTIRTPNDLLGLAYVKEVLKHQYPMNLHCILRTNDFHSQEIENISSATALRLALKQDINVSNCLPKDVLYKEDIHSLEQFYPILRYKLLTSSPVKLKQLHLVEEGLENLMIQKITQTATMEDFVTSLTSKRYTRGRIQRMLIHVLMDNTKEEIQQAMAIDYIRILKMNEVGRKYLSFLKKYCLYTIVTTFSKYHHPALSLEYKATKLYSCISTDPIIEIENEYKKIPI